MAYVMKSEGTDKTSVAPAMAARLTAGARSARAFAAWFGGKVLPPLVTVALLLLLWQLLCAKPGATLPPPSVIWRDARDLIAQPFFDFGSQDIGLGWRVLVSLQRVAVGFGFAALAGILVGALIGQSEWAMRGLDPIFQVLRTVPPLAWLPLSLAGFRDSHPSALFMLQSEALTMHVTVLHRPAMQTPPAEHAAPQRPQFASSVCRSTQAAPHRA